MSTPHRVLVVDDSAVARAVVCNALESAPELSVLGTAGNGEDGVAKARKLRPDAVTLDVEMPTMDGLQALKVLKKEFPDLPVVMVSNLTQRGAEATIEALMAGADGYVAKPAQRGRRASVDLIAQELVPKLRALLARRGPRDDADRATPSAATPAPPAVQRRSAGSRPPSIVAIASSTGGPKALLEVLLGLPKGFDLPIVVVQHMPEMFTEMLAKRLSAATPFDVREGVEGAALAPGRVWIAPGGSHMSVTPSGAQSRLVLDQSHPVNSCRPAADVLFRSVAERFGPAALALVLTGMGRDGLEGCRAIREAGGEVLVQDRATSVVWGMPRCVAKSGLADAVLPLSEIAGAVADRSALGAARRRVGQAHASEA